MYRFFNPQSSVSSDIAISVGDYECMLNTLRDARLTNESILKFKTLRQMKTSETLYAGLIYAPLSYYAAKMTMFRSNGGVSHLR